MEVFWRPGIVERFKGILDNNMKSNLKTHLLIET